MSQANYQNKPPRIGVSILTLFWIIFPFKLEISYGTALHRFAVKNNIGLQLLPFWWLTEEDFSLMRALGTPIISYEDRWNSRESLYQILVRGCCFWKPSWDPVALLGFFLFGTKKQSEKRIKWFREYFPDAFAVDTLGMHHLMETSETNGVSVIQYATFNGDVCFDTWHAQGPKDELLTLEAIEGFVNALSDSIKLIHCQTRNHSELWDFIHSRTTRLERILDMLKPLVKKNNIPIIIEFKPCSRTMLEAVKETLEDIFS